MSSNTSYIESASGVGEGARTGLASVVTGVMFLLATVFTPLVSVIPNEAATPALVLVGFLMMTQVKNIDWDDVEVALPAFLTIVLMPFTYNITVGHRRRLHRPRAHQGGARQGPRDPRRSCGWSRRCSSSTSRSTRCGSSSASRSGRPCRSASGLRAAVGRDRLGQQRNRADTSRRCPMREPPVCIAVVLMRGGAVMLVGDVGAAALWIAVLTIGVRSGRPRRAQGASV